MHNSKSTQSPLEGGHPPRDWVAEEFSRLATPLVGYVTKLFHGDSETAQDVVQEAFVKLCQQTWPEIRPHATAWLYRTCRNRVIDINRREGRMNRSPEGDMAVLHDRRQSGPLELAEQGEQFERLRLQIQQLSEQQQEILRLRLHDNLSYKQIAEVTGLTAGNVGYHLHQAIATLRVQVTKART